MACDRNRSDLDQGEALAALGCSGRTLRKARATENVPESCRIGSTYEAIIALPLPFQDRILNSYSMKRSIAFENVYTRLNERQLTSLSPRHRGGFIDRCFV